MTKRKIKSPWACQTHDGKWLGDMTDWTASKEGSAKHGVTTYVPIQRGKSRETIALVVWEGMDGDHIGEERARLIASAPLLLEALKLVVDCDRDKPEDVAFMEEVMKVLGDE